MTTFIAVHKLLLAYSVPHKESKKLQIHVKSRQITKIYIRPCKMAAENQLSCTDKRDTARKL